MAEWHRLIEKKLADRKITPDEVIKVESPEEIRARMREKTAGFLAKLGQL